MHLGHVLPLYLAKRFQRETGATVYIPLSDDEKFLAKAQSFESIGKHTRDNLRDILAVGFDPERTRIVVDTADADVIYPIATRLAKHLTPATIEAVYGEQDSVGLQFYPAVQATHLLLPQLVAGRQPTLVPIAIDQAPTSVSVATWPPRRRCPSTNPVRCSDAFSRVSRGRER